jgi:hypothetical protein
VYEFLTNICGIGFEKFGLLYVSLEIIDEQPFSAICGLGPLIASR